MLFGKRERLIQRILVVEDEPLVAFDNEHLLGEAGYEVVATVDSLEDARAVIESEEKIDLVLTDISLSGEGDGTDVARIAGGRGIPVLFVSGACPEGAQSLAVGCLSKPYSEKVMKAALDCLDEVLQGNEVKKLPPQLSLYERAAG
ncbi:MAG TPA: response regulator [Allosphingosinicella sp.]|nr:response regulator [Allosphingosinicella sp.]